MEPRIRYGHRGILLLVVLSTFIIFSTDGIPVTTEKSEYLNILNDGPLRAVTEVQKSQDAIGNYLVSNKAKDLNINSTSVGIKNKNKLSSLIPLFGGFFGIFLVVLVVYFVCLKINQRSTEEYYSIIPSGPEVTTPNLPTNLGLKGRRRVPVFIPGRNIGNPPRYLHSNLRISYSAPAAKSSLADYFNGPDYQPQRAYLLPKRYQYQILPESKPSEEKKAAGHLILSSTRSFTGQNY